MMHRAWRNIVEVPYYFSRSCVKFQGHTGQKIANFDLNWAFPGCNSISNSRMALKLCTNLNTTYKMCPIFVKVIHEISRSHGRKKMPILTQIERFRTVTPVWIHRWMWNDAQSLIRIDEVPYYFSRSSIKLQCHTGWKIDLNPISARSLDRSQLSNPSDLPGLL